MLCTIFVKSVVIYVVEWSNTRWSGLKGSFLKSFKRKVSLPWRFQINLLWRRYVPCVSFGEGIFSYNEKFILSSACAICKNYKINIVQLTYIFLKCNNSCPFQLPILNTGRWYVSFGLQKVLQTKFICFLTYVCYEDFVGVHWNWLWLRVWNIPTHFNCCSINLVLFFQNIFNSCKRALKIIG